MKTKGQYQSLGTRTINGKRVSVAEHRELRFFKIGSCNIAAATLDEAITKFQICMDKRAK